MLLNIFNSEGLLDSLPIMAKGMLGIFCVTGIIILTMLILERATKEKTEQE